MTWPVNGLDLNPIENLWWKLKTMVYKFLSAKGDLLTLILESFLKEYYFKLEKSLAEKIKSVRKAPEKATKNLF